jgi:hypothetical protein
MRTKIVLVLIILSNSSLLFGQTKEQIDKIKYAFIDSIKNSKKPKQPKQPTLVAVYDYLNNPKPGFITDELRPKHKQPVVLKIININKLAHNVLITENDVKIKDDYLDTDTEAAKTILDQTKPAELITSDTKSLNTEAPKEVVERNDKNIQDIKGNIQSLQILIEFNKRKLWQVKEKLELNKTELATLESDLEKYNNSKRIESINEVPDQSKIVQLEKEINTKKKSISDLKIVKGELNDEVYYLNLKIEGAEIQLMTNNDNLKNFKLYLSKINEKFHDIQMNLVNINRINGAYTNYINFIIIPTLTKKQYADYASKICTIVDLEKRKEYYGYIKEFETTYVQFNQQYDSFFNSDAYYDIIHLDQNTSYSKLVKLNLENLKIEVERIYKIVNTTELRTKLHNVELFDNVLSGDNAFIVYSDPIQSFQDYLEFKVKITQNKNLGTSILTEQDKEFTYTEYVRQSVRWDFSVGTVYDFGIKNQEYEIKKNEATSKYQIVENNSTEYTPTIAGLLHTSFRSNSMFAFGFSLGASIDLTKLNFNSFFPGVSLLIGKKQKLIFTVGPALKRVNQLKAIYDTNTDYTEQLQTENVTSSQFKTGWFAAISWNLTNAQKSKIIPQK